MLLPFYSENTMVCDTWVLLIIADGIPTGKPSIVSVRKCLSTIYRPKAVNSSLFFNEEMISGDIFTLISDFKINSNT